MTIIIRCIMVICQRIIKQTKSYNLSTRMRKFLCSVLLLCSGLTAAAQNAEDQMSQDLIKQTLQLDSIASSYYVKEDYEEALVYLLRETMLLETTPDAPHYVEALLKMGLCYEKLNIPFKAIEANKRAITLHSNKESAEDLFIANRSNNIANLYLKMEDTEEATRWSREAMRISSKIKPGDGDRMKYLTTAAQVAFAAGKPSNAIEYQKAILDIAEKHVNPHHEDYLNLLTTLRVYYSSLGNDEERDKVSNQIRQLRKELEEGILPNPTELNTPQQCRRHNTEALLCSRWILGNYLSTTGMKQAAEFITKYRRNTPDVAVYLGPTELSWVKKNAGFHVAYIAASVEYALTHPDEERYSVNQYKAAIYRLLDYYEENKSFAGEIKKLDKYLSMKDTKPEELEKRLEENFKEFTEVMKSRKNGHIDVEDPVLLNFSY